MKEWLVLASEQVIVVIDGIALLIIVAGTIRAVVGVAHAMITHAPGVEVRAGWINYARVLIAALTLQLAADIVESAISTSWESIGRLAAIAVIRTFLNYFLERDMTEVRERQRPSESGAPERQG